MHNCDVAAASFERHYGDGTPSEQTPLEPLPFSIGRADDADLQIDSNRVSREHASVIFEGGAYRIRDLGSTNGTFVNGQPIDEVVLNDGDLVTIADCELTFVRSEPSPGRRMATQVMTTPPARGNAADRILAVRHLQESVLHRAFVPQLNEVLNLESDRPFGWYADTFLDELKSQGHDWLAASHAASHCSVWHACQLYRTLAAEHFLKQEDGPLLIVRANTEEVEQGASLWAHLNRLREMVGSNEFMVSLAATGVTDVPEVSLFYNQLLDEGFRLALHEFLGTRAQLMQLADAAPELLILSAAATREGDGNARQRRQLNALLDACRELGTRAVVTGASSHEREQCRQLGFTLALARRGVGFSTTGPPPKRRSHPI